MVQQSTDKTNSWELKTCIILYNLRSVISEVMILYFTSGWDDMNIV